MKQVATRFPGLNPSAFRLFVSLCAVFLATGLAMQDLALATPLPAEHENAAPGIGATPTPVSRIRHATAQVYRLIVEMDGAIKGGTGFLVSGRRIVATNHHVIEKGTAFTLGFVDDDHRIRRVPLRLIAIYPQKDLALLEALDDLPGEALPVFAGHPDAATDLFAIGFPAAADPQGTMWWTSGTDDTFFVPSVIKGYVSRVLPNRWFSSQLQHQTPIIPGYSGGPLVDNDGVVIGISTSVHKEANGISYAVLGADLADFVAACGLPMKGDSTAEAFPLRDATPSSAVPPTVKTFAVQSQPATSESDRAMLERANRMLIYGDIVAARLILDYLVNHRRMAEAVSSMAKSYDPLYLKQQKVLGVSGDAAKAAQLYKQAADLGDHEAKQILTSIANGTCSSSLCSLANGDQGPQVVCERGKL